MVPKPHSQVDSKISQSIKNFTPQHGYKNHSISGDEEARYEWTNKLINQMLMSIKDEYIRNKYYNFIKENQIEIVSDIFERMDTDRRLKDELK